MKKPSAWNPVFWLGVLVTVNLFLIPTRDASPRVTDLLGVGLALVLLVRAHRRGLPALPLSALAVANLLPLIWAAYALYTREVSTLVEAARWLLALPWAMSLLVLVEDRDDRGALAWGLAAGCAMNVAVVGMQYFGLNAPLRPLGIAIEDADFQHYWAGNTRLSGLHRHHAATAAVTSLLIPVSAFLYFRRAYGLWLPLVSLGLVAITLHLTFTRSPLVVTAATLAVAVLTSRQPRKSFVLAAVLAALAIPALLVIGPPGGKARWGDTLSLEANAGERVLSSVTAAKISIENPQGLGVKGGKDALIEETAMRATHNAFFQASLHLGLPLALALLVALLHWISVALLGGRPEVYLEALVGVHLFGLFLFEEHLNNPTFIILASWLIASSVRELSARRSLAGDAPRSPTRRPA